MADVIELSITLAPCEFNHSAALLAHENDPKILDPLILASDHDIAQRFGLSSLLTSAYDKISAHTLQQSVIDIIQRCHDIYPTKDSCGYGSIDNYTSYIYSKQWNQLSIVSYFYSRSKNFSWPSLWQPPTRQICHPTTTTCKRPREVRETYSSLLPIISCEEKR